MPHSFSKPRPSALSLSFCFHLILTPSFYQKKKKSFINNQTIIYFKQHKNQLQLYLHRNIALKTPSTDGYQLIVK